MLRVLEREIDVGEDGRFTVAVAAPADEIEGAMQQAAQRGRQFMVED